MRNPNSQQFRFPSRGKLKIVFITPARLWSSSLGNTTKTGNLMPINADKAEIERVAARKETFSRLGIRSCDAIHEAYPQGESARVGGG
ncbi:hypothetical protein AAG906_002340 [Vitis piasezkii]